MSQETESNMSNEPIQDEAAGDEPTAAVASEAAVESPAPDAPAGRAAVQSDRSARKVRDGIVTSNAMDKTAVVDVSERVRHPRYNKFVLRSKRLYVHDEDNDANVGDRVRVMETRPLSKSKRWRVVEILERAK